MGKIGLMYLAVCAAAFVQAAPKTANYWCTWETQNYTIDPARQMKTLGFVGDQGAQGARDNIDEEVIFGKDGKGGWIEALPPETRAQLYFLIDDGWDVGYGHAPGKDIEVFGSLEVATNRFPSFTGTPAERLRKFNAAVVRRGWKGLGLWCATQQTGEKWKDREKPFDDAASRRLWREKLGWVRAAGIGYLKFDWGVRGGDVAFRRMLSELAKEIIPDVVVEQCTGAWPINEPERMIGNPAYDENRAKAKELMGFADVFRFYDLLNPFTTATGVERAAFYLGVQAEAGGTCVLSTEDEIYLGASLGCAWGAMRSPFAPDARYPVRPVNRKMNEVVRATAWQHLVAPFASKEPPRISSETLSDTWFFKKGEGWYEKAQGHTTVQKAPAVIARGMALPTVRSAEADGLVPFVTACRAADGSVSLGAIPRVDEKRGWLRPKAHLAIAERPTRLAVFGVVASVTFPSAAPRLYARDLAGEAFEEITAACTHENGRWMVPGEVLNRIGTAKNGAGDLSDPGTLILMESPATACNGIGLLLLGDVDSRTKAAFASFGCRCEQVDSAGNDCRTARDQALRALRSLRGKAQDLGVDPARIGVFGRGENACLAAELAASGEAAFAVAESLSLARCGKTASAMPSEKAAPLCLFERSDESTRAEAAIALYRAWRLRKVPAELHLTATDAVADEAVAFLRQLDLDRRLGSAVTYQDHLAPEVPMRPMAREDIWPAGRMPDVRTNQCVPFIEWHIPEKLSTRAVQIVYSGGSYVDNHPELWDGIPAARRYLNEKGMAVVVLKYRTPRPDGLPKHQSAWQDLQRTVRLVRAQAARRGLDPARIGILGTSAGGHLTLMGTTSATVPAYGAVDEIDALSCDVQWGVAVYPAYVLTDGADGTNKNGGNLDSDVLVPDFAFDAKTAPTLFLHGDGDCFSAMGSVRCWQKLRTLPVPSELHTLALRGHCFMNESSPGTASYGWLDRVWVFLSRLVRT